MTTRIGMFDSGVGGLSVWRELVRAAPQVSTLYVADHAHVPYGPRDRMEIIDFARGITGYLVSHACRTIVVACNTASAAALETLRREFDGIEFVGMEPAIKPAAALSRNGVIGVLATEATLNGDLFHSTLERYLAGMRVIPQVCPGLVERIEAGERDGDSMLALLRPFVEPALRQGADTLVLACTHYPFVRPAIQRLAGDAVQVVDPAPAVARRVIEVAGLNASRTNVATVAAPTHRFRTSGDVAQFERVSSALLERATRAQRVFWRDRQLVDVDIDADVDAEA